MTLLRNLFFRKPPDGLLEISDRVYVFDCCFTTDAWEEQNYKGYVGGMMTQLKEHYPDASVLVFNFREGETPSLIANVLSEYEMTIMEYPRQYEGCPLLPMEVIHHFLRSTESWLSLGLQNLLLVHCEHGGWPVLAFMMAALLIYRKQYSGEHKTLEMVYKQAPRELLQLVSPVNPRPSQLRYLQYVSRRNVAVEWPPLDRVLNMDCVIIRMIPNFDGKGGCQPIFRVYGKDPSSISEHATKVLFSTPKKSRTVRHYKQADCELVKFDINCCIRGDVVLECISLHDDMEGEEMMFRVMFSTAFIRSNILMLNREEIDVLWDTKDQFPKDFRAEVIFSEMDAAASAVPVDISNSEEKDGLPAEAFAKVQEFFSSVDFLVPRTDAFVDALQHRIVSDTVMASHSHAETPQEIQSAVVEYGTKSSTDFFVENQSNFSSLVSQNEVESVNKPEPHSRVPTSHAPNFSTSKQHELSLTEALNCAPLGESDSVGQENIVAEEVSNPLETDTSPGTFSSTSQNKITQDADVIKSDLAFFTSSSISCLIDVNLGRPLFDAETSTPLTTHLEDKIDVPNGVPIPLLPQEIHQSNGTFVECSLPTPAPPPSTASSTEDATEAIRFSTPPPSPFLSSATHSSSTVDVGTRVEIPLSVIALSSNINDNEASEGLTSSPSTCPPLRFVAPLNESSSIRGEPSLPKSPIPTPSPRVSPVKEHPVSKFTPSPPLTPPFTENTVGRPPTPPLPYNESESTKAPRLSPPPSLHSGRHAGSISSSSMSKPSPPPAPSDFLRPIPGPPTVPLAPQVPNKLVASSPGAPSPPPPSIPPPGIKGKTPLLRTANSRNDQKKKLKLLHWSKLLRTASGSLWAEAQKSGEASKALEINISELEFHFALEVSNTDRGGRFAGSRNKPERVQLIDHRRAYNCEIMLSNVKIPLNDLLSTVLALDENALDVDQVGNFIKFCPTKEEMELLKGYKGDKDKLGKCEQFFLHLMQVPRIESKLRVYSFKIQFCTQVSDLRNNLNIVNSAVDQIRGSAKLKRIMLTILSLGNALNQGTAKGSAVGFRLDSLLKLSETRAMNGKTTLMHYLCKMLADKLPELLDFWQDLSSLEPASKIQLKYLAEEMQAINKGLEKVVQELSVSENDGPVSDQFHKALKEFLSFSESEVRSLASLYSGVGRNVDALILYFGEDPSRCPFEQVISTLLNFVRMYKKAHEENCKQLEFERKKAEKEASLKGSDTGHFLQSPIRSVKQLNAKILPN